MAKILVLYYSRGGATARLARQIARGVDSVDAAEAVLRRVPALPSAAPKVETQTPEPENDSAPTIAPGELASCDGLILGSPTRFGNMAAPVKALLDGTGDLWFSGALAGKPAAVFTSTSSLHGGQESTLLSMIVPLLHHGMLITGIPYTEPRLTDTSSGGTPYGASHWAGPGNDRPQSDEEAELARALGRRVADIAVRLA